ncbi:MAG: hypothetical protein NZ484_00165 [Patescibacteria group bacterium]|nr:hypothetical protein [Patescibacteria group bacterium]MCX7589914.1 hypothetical protein [Patescibacteria group bacterium]MDW8279594.1 hypothetical protein [bacterium]
MGFFQEYCFDCGHKKIVHFESWVDDFLSLLPPIKLSTKFVNFFDYLLEKIFLLFKLLKYEKIENVSQLNISLRSKLFINKLILENYSIFIGKSIFGYTNHFKIKNKDKEINFYGLPTPDQLNYKINLIDHKDYIKKQLIKNNFPVPKGKIFWFWQKNKALEYGKKIGFPLVVKPVRGSVARHVTTNIFNEKDLLKGILKALEYSPSFIIEEFIYPAFVFRATVIDNQDVFCVKQIPANIVGDGKLSIEELIKQKNNDPLRGKPHDKNFILYKILINETTKELLNQKGYTFKDIPQKGEIIYLQKDPFLRLGGDLKDYSLKMHSDNKELFLNISKLFNIKLVGIDFMIENIENSWKNQRCGILELNTLPSIELHAIDAENDILESMYNFFKKYYL